MPSSFVVYIDESGDEGFKFLPGEAGSTRWFVLSAMIYRTSNFRAPIVTLERVRKILKRERNTPLHFRDLRHEHRVVFVEEIARERARIVSILVCKQLIDEPDAYQSTPYLLYRYVTRLLLERVSWLCRDNRKTGEGDGTAQLVFSNRSAMSYDDLRSYLELLQSGSGISDVQIDWSVISPSRVRAVNHEKLAGLQVADAIASSFLFACNRNLYGRVEPRYAQTLRHQLYRHRGKLVGYGIKCWPNLGDCKKEMPHVAAFEEM